MDLTPCEITPEQSKAWDLTVAALQFNHPAFCSLLFSMLQPKGQKHMAHFTEGVPVAATDGKRIYVNPKMLSRPVQERIFIVAHEISHCIFAHCEIGRTLAEREEVSLKSGSVLPYDGHQMNVAADYVINDLLHESKVGVKPADCMWDVKIATHESEEIETYGKIFDPSKSGGGGAQGGMSGDCLAPPADAPERNETEWKAGLSQARDMAKAMGKLPAALDQAIADLVEPKVDWTELIEALLHRALGGGGYDWRHADRRMMVMPGVYAPKRTGHSCGLVVVGVDSSGSIYSDPKLIHRFLSEVGGILEDAQPERILLMWCDASVQRVHEIESAGDLQDVVAQGAMGGGGTAFEPVFERIAEMGVVPDTLVYLTDGFGSFPDDAPPYPVVWGNTTPGLAERYPFGAVVDIPVAEAA